MVGVNHALQCNTQVVCLRKTVEEAYAPLFGLQPPLIPYRDASFGICTYHLEVLDCVRALARAASLGHFNLDTFNGEQYAFYDKIEHGDLNWIIPGKFVAFSGPLARYAVFIMCHCCVHFRYHLF